MDVTVEADDVRNLLRAIRTHADKKALRKELYSGINRVSKGVREEMKKSTGDPANLPTQGGLQALMMARQSVTASARGGKYPGVRIKVGSRKGGPDLGAIYRTGRVMHRTFGGGRFVLQAEGVKPRWMDPVFDKQKPEIQRAITRVLEDVARKVTS